VHHQFVLVMLLYGVYTTCGCFGAVDHGHNGGLYVVFTCSWRVANFGSATLSTALYHGPLGKTYEHEAKVDDDPPADPTWDSALSICTPVCA
jgi:hypothetical protein